MGTVCRRFTLPLAGLLLAGTVAANLGGGDASDATASPIGAGEPTRWARLCNTDSLLYLMGDGGAYVKWGASYPTGTDVLAVRWDGDLGPGQRGCVSYLLRSDAFAVVPVGLEPPTDAPEAAILTAGQPMFEDAIEAARGRVGLNPTGQGFPTYGELRDRFSRQAAVWGCQGGPEAELWLYLTARGYLLTTPEAHVAIRSKGDRFWNTVLDTDYMLGINGCKP